MIPWPRTWAPFLSRDSARPSPSGACPCASFPRSAAELCRLAVARDGGSLQYVPFALRDRELCLTAVEKGASLGYVPDTLRDREVIRLWCSEPLGPP
ncbi:DUF4116 domain-containing protein [Archangium violaceum]|uniref:DUF4116 domain-containing protein n=1 Tax=Archangium violaceum TaxID=83451 RepID=UPI0034E1C7AB